MKHAAYFRAVRRSTDASRTSIALTIGVAILATVFQSVHAQDPDSLGDLGACTLRNHVYTCEGAAMEKALAGATTASLETHNADGIARNALKSLVVDKLHKTIVPDGSPADLVFLLMPIDRAGQVEDISAVRDLGTLRVYSTTAEGRPAHLLWAETYSTDPTGHDMPWPLVARNIVQRFEKRFQIR